MYGFFLSRYELEQGSACGDFECGASHSESVCWHPQQYDKLVLVAVDALRFDFAFYNRSYPAEDDSQLEEPGVNKPYFVNELKALHRVLESSPDNAKLYRFVADAPTVTMQRLKGLTTGGLPTFIEMKDNFESNDAITEDNFVSLLFRAGRRMVFMGSDYWTQLFPDAWATRFPYPALNVKDLHGVDDIVKEHLLPALRGDKGAWDVIVAHFEGVDHVGHTFHADHPQMQSKLRSIDEYIARVIKHIQSNMEGERVLLAVLGDHGMTEEGDHGGATAQETDSALFFYSSTPVFKGLHERSVPHTKLLHGFPSLALREERTDELLHDSVQQIDLAPTLSLLMGVPIPFGNIGKVMPELFAAAADESILSSTHGAGTPGVGDALARVLKFFSSMRALQVNAWQVRRYLGQYQDVTGAFDDALLAQLHNFVEDTNTRCDELLELEKPQMNQIQVADNFTVVSLAALTDKSKYAQDKRVTHFLRELELNAVSVIAMYEDYIHKASDMCREKWTTFNVPVMAIGLAVLCVSVVWRCFRTWKCFMIDAEGGHLCSAAGAFIAVLLGIHWQGLFSNSFIINEQRVAVFSAVSIWVCMMAHCWQTRGWPRRANDWLDFFAVAAVGFALRTMTLVAGSRPHVQLALNGEWDNIAPLVSLAMLLVVVFMFCQTWWRSESEVLVRAISCIIPMVSSVLVIAYWILGMLWCEADGQIDSISVIAGVNLSVFPKLQYILSLGSCIALFALRSDVVVHHAFFPLLLPVFMLVLGPRSATIALMFCVCLYGLRRYISLMGTGQKNTAVFTAAGFLWFAGIVIFYASNHKPEIGAVHVAAGFVGLEYSFYFSLVLILLNTFAGYLWSVLGSVCIAERALDARQLLLVMASFWAIRTWCSALNAIIQRRHLMVWAIFAPKFLFDAACLALLDACFLLLAVALKTGTKRKFE
jgi:phosphatidylinositol glycan class O